jgi:hypothetical protein
VDKQENVGDAFWMRFGCLAYFFLGVGCFSGSGATLDYNTSHVAYYQPNIKLYRPEGLPERSGGGPIFAQLS